MIHNSELCLLRPFPTFRSPALESKKSRVSGVATSCGILGVFSHARALKLKRVLKNEPKQVLWGLAKDAMNLHIQTIFCKEFINPAGVKMDWTTSFF